MTLPTLKNIKQNKRRRTKTEEKRTKQIKMLIQTEGYVLYCLSVFYYFSLFTFGNPDETFPFSNLGELTVSTNSKSCRLKFTILRYKRLVANDLKSEKQKKLNS